jgi:hypothetical protein
MSITEAPYPLSEMNLSNWHHGGYRDWLRDKSKTAVGLPSVNFPPKHCEIKENARKSRTQTP